MPISYTQGSNKYYLHYDQVGSLKAVTDNNHNIIKEIVYDSFGNILSDSNPSIKVPFAFAGGLYDEDTKLLRFGYRDYDSYTGKWTAKDPIDFDGDGYVLNDPVNFVDVNGLHGEKNPIDAIVSIWNQKEEIGNDIVCGYNNSHPAMRVSVAVAVTISTPALVYAVETVDKSKVTTDFIDGLTGGQPTNKSKTAGRIVRKIIEEVIE